MRGRIQVLNVGRTAGVIQADSGDSMRFEFSAVLAYDVAFLAVGRVVTFDVEGRDGSSVVNICLYRPHASPEGAPRRPASLRYVGFEQAKGLRSYKFERTPAGEEMTTTVVVTTDMTLFTRHRVQLQEGPGLCLRLLETESADGRESAFTLTEKDLITFLAARAGAMKPLARRIWRRPRSAPSALFLTPQGETGR
jgi:hypothetical protein